MYTFLAIVFGPKHIAVQKIFFLCRPGAGYHTPSAAKMSLERLTRLDIHYC